MKNMIRIAVTDAARETLHAQGGPGPIIGRLLERFQPETVCMSPARRELFMVCDLGPDELTALQAAASDFAGQPPEIIAVIDGEALATFTGTGACPLRRPDSVRA